MTLDEFLEEYSEFQVLEPCDEDEFDGGEEINPKEVCRRDDGLTLLEFDLTVMDSPVSIETVCELFPDYDVDINKGYMLKFGNRIITE
ncbi:MAG: hypothetical protein IKX60_09035 [Bacteroidales bacterium]|nr:hypothetical protein [Bacteroidales bacterium]